MTNEFQNMPSRKETHSRKNRKSKKSSKMNLPIFNAAKMYDFSEYQKPELKVLATEKPKKPIWKKLGIGALAFMMFGTAAGASLLMAYDDSKLDNVMTAINDFVDGAEQTQAELQASIDGLNADIVAKNAKIAEYEQTIAGNNQTIADKQTTIDELEQRLEQAIANGDSAAAELQQQLDDMTAERDSLKTANEKLITDKQQLEQDLIDLQAELDVMTAKYDEQVDLNTQLVAELQRANTKTSEFENEALTKLGVQATNPDNVTGGTEEAGGNVPAQPNESPDSGEVTPDEEGVTAEWLESNVTASYTPSQIAGTNGQKVYLHNGDLVKFDGASDYYIQVNENDVIVYNSDGTINKQVEYTNNVYLKKTSSTVSAFVVDDSGVMSMN